MPYPYIWFRPPYASQGFLILEAYELVGLFSDLKYITIFLIFKRQQIFSSTDFVRDPV